MDEDRLNALLSRFPGLTILVAGDFFLDKYLIIDRALSEISLETGREAYQVVETRTSPGAAGTVVCNLRALEVNVLVLGATGDDGEGYELRRKLAEWGVDPAGLAQLPGWFTPTYTKPMLREKGQPERELERLDIKNRAPLPPEAEQILIARLRELAPQVDGVAVIDQVQEPNCGLITNAVRAEISALARLRPGKPFLADSRARIGLFREVMLKPNRDEAAQAISGAETASPADVTACGLELSRRVGRPVFVTLGAKGILVCEGERMQRIPAAPVAGPIDPVGAGDSATAGIIAALCAGAAPEEAALVGNLAASITIRQLGTTGTATRREIQERFRQLPG